MAGEAPARSLTEGGSLRWAVASPPSSLDPLFADDPAEQLISRQLHEPLVERLRGPSGDSRALPGPALSFAPTKDPTEWRARLRPGIRFGDGTPLDGQAVLANAERWQASGARSGLPAPPDLFVFSPRPNEVRFKLSAPDPTFGEMLASPRLGLISPAALRRARGAEIRTAQAATSGTGPFELRERSDAALVLARNAEWWGAERGLGPGLDQIEFVVSPSEPERTAMLADGEVQVAGELGPAAQRTVAANPLLSVVSEPTPGLATAAERSVRGIPAEEPVPSLNGVWQTLLLND